MLLRTKKLFQKTIDSIKIFVSKGSSAYERLPKTPPFQRFSCGRDGTDKDIETRNKELEKFYSEFTKQWDSQRGKLKLKLKLKLKNKTAKKQTVPTSETQLQEPCRVGNCNYGARREAGEESVVPIFTKQMKETETYSETNAERGGVLKAQRSDAGQVLNRSDQCSRSVREKRLSSVVHKLQELEHIDKGNVDYKLDIEQFLHYYSRLTCPAYLDIVDKFLLEMCAEFFSSEALLHLSSTPKSP